MRLAIHTLLAVAAFATSGGAIAQVSIDHNKVVAGNFNPGDPPGYPLTLSQPGHYVLKGNLVVPTGVNGVEISGTNVTLDLNGFSIIGPGSCTRNASTRVVTCTAVSGPHHGVWIKFGAMGAVVRHGRSMGFTTGVFAQDRVVIDDMVVTQNITGLSLDGANASRVTNLVATLNGGSGVDAITTAVIERSQAMENGASGFLLPGQVTVYDSVAQLNRGWDIVGGTARGLRAESKQNVLSMGGNIAGNTPF